MKLYWLFLILMALPSVNALGNTFDLDFDSKDNYPLLMNKGDRVLFEYGGYNHTIILDDLKKGVAELDIFLFLESDPHTPNYVYLSNSSALQNFIRAGSGKSYKKKCKRPYKN